MRTERHTERHAGGASPFRIYLLSDLVLVILVLLTMLPYIFNTLLEFNKRIDDNLTATVTHVADDLDAMLSTMETTLTSSDSETLSSLSTLAALRSAGTGKDYYAMRKVMQYLSYMTKFNSSLHQLLVAYPQSGVVLTSTGAFDSVESFNRYYKDDTLYNDAFISPIYPSGFLPQRTLQYSSPTLTKDVFGYSFSLKSWGRVRICLLIDTQDFLGTKMLSAISENGCAVLTDGGGQIISHMGALPEGDDLRALPDAGDYVTVRYTTATGRLTLSARTPKMLSTNALAQILPLLMASLAAAVVAGALYSTLIARYRTRPFTRLLSQLQDTNRQVLTSANRISMMQNLTEKLKQENEQFTRKLDDFRRARYENAVTRLFTAGHISDEDIRCIRENFGDLPKRYFVAYGRIGDLQLNGDYQDELSMISFDQLRQSLPEHCLVYLANPRAVGVLFDADLDLEKIRLAETFTDVDWSFSRIYEGPAFVSVALEEARLVRHRSEKSRHELSVQAFLRVYQCMIAGDDVRAKEQVSRIFDAATIENMQYLYDGVRCVVYLAANEYECVSVVPVFDKRMAIGTLIGILHSAVDSFCREINAHKRSRNETRKKKILDYIEENYADSGLYAASIAEHAGISEKYLYNFIKEQTGCSVGEYLQRLRMQKAQEYLLHSDTPIKEIFSLVGFNSENSFYKAFKRACGVTPSQYREAAGKNVTVR